MNVRKWLAALATLGIATLALTLADQNSYAVDAHQILVFSSGLNSGTAFDDTTAVGMADSTSIMDTGRYERLYLWIKADKACRIAIQIRSHVTVSNDGSASVGDSTGVGVFSWRSANFGTVNTAGDTLNLDRRTISTSVQQAFDELAVSFPAIGASKWGSPRAAYIPICDTGGGWYWGRQTSIRVRVLSGPGTITFTAYLYGVSF